MLSIATLNRILTNVPEEKAFHTIAEMDENSRKLADEYPDLVSLLEIGKTRQGHPLYSLKIGNGSKNALLLGCPHPNEPVGAMLLEYFSRALAEDRSLRQELDYTWYIIKAWDADGVLLNEGWFKGPFTLYHYARNYYRPPGTQQVDWTFPIDYKNLHFNAPIPETQAVMKLIEETHPVFNYTLHNAGFGGVYFYVSRPTDEIYDTLRTAAGKQQIPLNLGEPEVPFIERLSPAVFRCVGIRDAYDYYEKYGVEHPELLCDTGTSSADYAEHLCGTFTLLTELPYFYDKRIEDQSLSDMLRKDAVIAGIDQSEKVNRYIKEILQGAGDYLSVENPFGQALDAALKSAKGNDATRKMVSENQDYRLLATQAEKFDNLFVSQFYQALLLSLLVRACEYELQKAEESDLVNPRKAQIFSHFVQITDERLRSLCAYLEENIPYEVIPIQMLVRVQLEAGLVTADYLLRA